MSVIVNMHMPTCCASCGMAYPLAMGTGIYCTITGNQASGEESAHGRRPDCPLIDMSELSPMALCLVRDFPTHINLLAAKVLDGLDDYVLHGARPSSDTCAGCERKPEHDRNGYCLDCVRART